MKSQKTKFIVISTLIVLLALILWKTFPKKEVKAPVFEEKMETKTEDKMMDKTTIKGNIMDLVKAGQNVMCTYSGDVNGIKLEGTSYVSGKKVRTNMVTVLEDGTSVDSHMLFDGEWAYTWSSLNDKGIKFRTIDTDKADTQDNMEYDIQNNSQMKDLETDYDFSCEKWNPDSSMFELPTSIEFTEFQTMKGTSDVNACDACNYLQGDAKSQCLTTLNCEQ